MRPLTPQEQAAFEAIRNHNLGIEPAIEDYPIVATLRYGTDEDKARLRAAFREGQEIRAAREARKPDRTSIMLDTDEIQLLRGLVYEARDQRLESVARDLERAHSRLYDRAKEADGSK